MTITNEAGEKTSCLGQFKNVIPGGRVFSTGFAFPQDRNELVIQNGTNATALTSATIAVNGAAPITVPLTSGEVYSQDLTLLLHSSPPLNTLVVTAGGQNGASAEVVVWGVGPFVHF